MKTTKEVTNSDRGPAGYKHSEESKLKMKKSRPNFSPSEKHIEAIRLANLNKVLSSETKSKMSTSKSHNIYVYTPDLKFLHKFSAITIAKLELRVAPKTIKKYCISGEVYNNKYRFSYTPLSNVEAK